MKISTNQRDFQISTFMQLKSLTWIYVTSCSSRYTPFHKLCAEGGIEVFCNKVIAGSTILELLFTSAIRLFLCVVELYFCSVKILWKLRILVEL
ncbi:hypothetical protein MKW92_050587 [Papaver armeniacum]|nr:hypothetical protein MKW92_050587 [Papaver armeniacum]